VKEQNSLGTTSLGRPRMCCEDVIKKDIKLMAGSSGERCEMGPMNANKKFTRTENNF